MVRRLPLVAFALLVVLPAGADEPRLERGGRAALARLRLDRDRLLPRVAMELETVSTFARSTTPGVEIGDHAMFPEIAKTVLRSAKSTTRHALRDYLFSTIGLDRGVARVRAGMPSTSLGGKDKMRFDFGVHSALPEVGLSRPWGPGVLRLGVGGAGDVGLSFRDKRFRRAEFSLGHDGDETVAFRARLGF
jgi:hypothetical protein